MTERKRSREEEGLQLQSCHAWPVSDFVSFSMCACFVLGILRLSLGVLQAVSATRRFVFVDVFHSFAGFPLSTKLLGLL